jgi:hypothetical protein
MPIFIKEPKVTVKPKAKSVPAEMIDAYKQYIEELELGADERGILTFEENENIKLGRLALQQAGISLQKYVKVMRARGSQDTLRFERISQQDYEALQQSFKARAEKIRAGRVKT